MVKEDEIWASLTPNQIQLSYFPLGSFVFGLLQSVIMIPGIASLRLPSTYCTSHPTAASISRRMQIETFTPSLTEPLSNLLEKVTVSLEMDDGSFEIFLVILLSLASLFLVFQLKRRWAMRSARAEDDFEQDWISEISHELSESRNLTISRPEPVATGQGSAPAPSATRNCRQNLPDEEMESQGPARRTLRDWLLRRAVASPRNWNRV